MALGYTDEQKACIESLIGPIDVSAGAGSGKTFTLTQRIATALADPLSGVDDIDQICAITFTEKAASELKGRIRSTLRAKGLFDQALKVDGAWISTIHSMCARILRAHALELGIDPSFEVMGDAEGGDLFDECLNEALRNDVQGQHRYKLLTETVAVNSYGFGSSIGGLVQRVLDASIGLDGGPRGLKRCQPGQSDPSVLARRLLCAYEDLIVQLEAQKEGAHRDEALSAALAGSEAMRAFLAVGGASPETLIAALDRCKFARKLTGKAIKPACEEYLAVHHEVVRLAVMAWNQQLADQLIELACDVKALITAKKRKRGALDNNDLVVLAMRALRVESVAADYAERFRLVMVDEFQDTDQVQLDIVSRLAGPGRRYLCTVGDAQQSIYGFRGADIQVYRAYQKTLDGAEDATLGAMPKKLLLSKNFRSHSDVLAFVRAVCQQPQVFGNGFLDLEPTYDGGKYKAPHPRIQVCLSVAPAKQGSSIDDARQQQATQIAQYFKQMNQGGHKLSEMVLLLGSTTQADVYAQAIRRTVGPCIVAGGSMFASAPEVAVVCSLCKAISNPRDEESLFAALSSEMFALGADDLIGLLEYWDSDQGCLRPCGISRGVKAAGKGLQATPSPELEHAVSVLRKAWVALGKVPTHRILLQAIQDSGWLLRLQSAGAEGLARAGNVLKAVRLVQSLEQDGHRGPAMVAASFAAELSVLREKPGALNMDGQEAVRIMTIHASKGLEFPIVALADFDRDYREEALTCVKVDGKPYLSLRLSPGKIAGQDQVSTAFANCPISDDAGSVDLLAPDAFHVCLSQRAAQAHREERQRLFYVGVTRAKEAVCVFLAEKESKKTGVCPTDSIAADIHHALFGGAGFPLESSQVDFGGSAPLAYHVAVACSEDAEGAEAQAQEAVQETAEETPVSDPVPVPEVKAFEWADTQLAPQKDTGLFSYSSLHAALDASGEEAALQGRLELEAVLSTGIVLDDYEGEDEIIPARRKIKDADAATEFGSAFHRMGQLAALVGFEEAAQHTDSLCKTYGVRNDQRLREAFDRWVASELRQRAYAYGCVRPEVPFVVEVQEVAGLNPGRKPRVMEGEIDLLCTNDGDMSRALVVDYKTGGYAAETAEQLRKKHGLQAQCYAVAVLLQGYQQVELAFYRVEQGNAISFTFTQEDLSGLRASLAKASAALG